MTATKAPKVRPIGGAWRNRIVGSGDEAPDQLLANPANWRTHPSAQRDALRGSPRHRRLGPAGPRQPAHRPRGRRPRPRRGGAQPAASRACPCCTSSSTPEEEALVLATLDPIGAMAERDDGKLTALLAEVTVDDAGLRRPARATLAARKAGRTDPDDVPEPPEDALRQAGRAVAARRPPPPVRGRHEPGRRRPPARRRGADASSPPTRRTASSLDPTWRDGVYNALGPAEAPYMRIDGQPDAEDATRAPRGRHGRTAGHRNTTLSGDTRVDWSEAFALVPSLQVGYVWHAGVHAAEVAEGLVRIGFEIVAQVIWDKGLFAMGRGPGTTGPTSPAGWSASLASPNLFLGSRDQCTVWRAPSPKMIMCGLDGGEVRPPGPEAGRPLRDPDPQPPPAGRLRPVPRVGHRAHRRRVARPPLLRRSRSTPATPRSSSSAGRRSPGGGRSGLSAKAGR